MSAYPPAEQDGRLFFPATERNRDAILEALAPRLTSQPCRVLEIAAGSGEHATYFAPRLSGVDWLATDLESDHLKSIDAWRTALATEAWVRPATRLDVSIRPWPLPDSHKEVDVLFCANLIHIAPRGVSHALFGGAADCLSRNGQFILYGPFMQGGAHTSDSNAAFDERLKEKDPDFGIRDLDWLDELAHAADLTRTETCAMPANNQFLVFRRTSAVKRG